MCSGMLSSQRALCYNVFRRLFIKGIQFVMNAKGEKVAVLIDLKKHGELWEDFYDDLIARSRAQEPRESLEAVKKRLRAIDDKKLIVDIIAVRHRSKAYE